MGTTNERRGLGKRVAHLLDRLQGRPVERDLSRYTEILERIDGLARKLELVRISDQELGRKAQVLGQRARAGASFDELRDEGYALAREASSRALGMRHYDVQLVAALALGQGRLVEMQTGEGKTLVGVLPAFVHGLAGRGAHVLTFNDYLAARDAQWMGPAYELLGLKVAHVQQGMSAKERRQAYRADVTYLTAREVGYDFLRQSLARQVRDQVLRPFHFALVDEADSIMIDEARIPLVLAGTDPNAQDRGRAEMASLVRGLEQDRDYSVDENRRNVFLTDQGQQKVQEQLGCGDLQTLENRVTMTKLQQALHAQELLQKDVDYVVAQGQVKVVDEFTGRVVEHRHWPDGLHRAIEAKEQLPIADQGRIMNSIPIQHLIGIYPLLAGMTGTALPAEDELFQFYGVKTAVVPSHRRCLRVDHPDLVYTNKEAKVAAIVAEVCQANSDGRPVLIGTASVAESVGLATGLRDQGIDCHVLNATNDEKEAEVIAQAGALHAVTVSTNMAGRGTDIRLGGLDEKDRDQVVALGGLYVIGTNRFESRRIDDQLRGRSGRQGDPGSSRFIVSLEDELITTFGLAGMIPARKRRQQRVGPVSDPLVESKIAQAQRIIEGQNLAIRRTLWDYSSFVEKQRSLLHEQREAVLQGTAPKRLAQLCPEKYAALDRELPREALVQTEIQITLFHLDRAWAEHLALVADIREGIYLVGLGGRNPLHEFYHQVSASYAEMGRQVDEGISRSFTSATVTPNGIDIDKEGLTGPTSTWTYLINDNPFDPLSGISSPGNIGLGIAAGIWGGLFVIKALFDRLRRH